MKSSILAAAVAVSGAAAELVVSEAPNTVQPYVIPNLKGTAYNVYVLGRSIVDFSLTDDV